MNIKAKVNLQSVQVFNGKASEAKIYTNSFGKGISCLERFQKVLYEKKSDVEDSIVQMQSAKEQLVNKIRDIEEVIARLNEELSKLQNELSDLESQLAATPETITYTDSDGEEYEEDNPEYDELEDEIEAVEEKISGVKSELYVNQQRLDKANSLLSQISKHIDSGSAIVHSIIEKTNTCKKLQLELQNIKISDEHAGIIALENLGKIIKIIEKYKSRKMTYDSTPMENVSAVPMERNNENSKPGINVQIVVDKSQTIINGVLPKDNAKHDIKINSEGRICEYDGKKFGGVYNSYDDRVKWTSDNNPILGLYEGDRGESKYIPSNRSAEGIVVIGILSEYGMNGIEYRNAEPDFEPCSVDTVKITGMTENREDYLDSSGVTQFGNFTQADIELARKWNSEKREGRDNWKGEDIRRYRKKNRLTWHEKCDMETMVLVRREINAFFRHVGGCSECKTRDSISDLGGGFDE